MSCPNSRTIPELRTEQFNSQELNDFLDHVSSCDYCYEVFRSEQSTSNDSNLEIEVHEALENSRLSEEPECREVLSRLLDQQDSNYFQEVSAPVFEPVSPGTILGDFYLEHVIARGGMGTVYAAEQISLKRRVAFKLINTGMQPADGVFQRFTNEAMALSRMDHPQIIPVLTCGHCGNSFYLVMPLIDGINLANLIQRLVDQRSRSTTEVCATTVETDFKEHPLHVSPDEESSFVVNLSNKMNNYCENYPRDIFGGTDIKSPEFIRNVVQQFICLADALQYVHDRGIIHRDIKPSNILIDREGKMRIGDFGVAKLDDNLTMTATHQLLGTPRYMSPEQIPGNKRFVDHRTDIYSLGITLYELLTLKSAFESGSIEEIMFRIEQEQPFSCRIYNPAIPLDLETIILKSIEKSSEDRYVSASLLADDLRRFLENKPVLAKRPGPSEHIIKWISRHRSAAAAIVAGMALMLIMSIVILAKVSDAVRKMEASQKVAEESLDQAIETTYASSFALGFRAYQDYDLSSAMEILKADKFKTSSKDYRGFEWPLLMQRIQGDSTSMPLSNKPLYCIAECDDRRLLAVAGQEAVIYLVNALDFSVQKTILTNQSEINDLDFSKEGSRLVSAEDNGSICVWNCQNGEQLLTIPAHDGVVYSASFFKDDSRIISHARDKEFNIWHSDTGENLDELKHHDDRIVISTINSSERLLASISRDHKLLVYDLVEQRLVLKKSIPQENSRVSVTALTFSPDSRFLYYGRKQGLISREDLLTKKHEDVASHRDEITSIRFDSEGSRLFTADVSGLVHIWSISDQNNAGQEVADSLTPMDRWTTPEPSRPGGFDVHPNGTWACIYHKGEVSFLNLQTRERQTLDFPATADLLNPDYSRGPDEDLLCFSPDGKWLTFLTEVFHLEDGKWSHHVKMSYLAKRCFALEYTNDSRSLISSIGSGRIIFADSWKGTHIDQPFKADDLNYRNLEQSDVIAVSNKDSFVAVGSYNCDILLYDVGTKNKIGDLPGNNHGIEDMDFSPDESVLAIARSSGNEIEFWHTQGDDSAESTQALEHDSNHIKCIQYSPNGLWLATSAEDNDGTVYLWDLNREQIIWRRPVPTSYLTFSTDNQRLYTFNEGVGEICCWDLSSLLSPNNETHLFASQQESSERILKLDSTRLLRRGESIDIVTQSNGNIVSVGEHGKLSVASESNRETIQILNDKHNQIESNVGTRTMSVGGNRLVALKEDQHLEVHGFTEGLFQLEKNIHAPEVTCVKFSSDGHLLFTGTQHGSLQSRDPETLKTVKTWTLAASATIEDIQVSFNGEYVGIIQIDPPGREPGRYLSLLNLSTGEESFPFGPDTDVDCFAFANQHNWISCGIDSRLMIRHLDNQNTTTFQIPKGHFRCIDFAPTDDKVAACSDRKVLLWDMTTHQQLSMLLGFDTNPWELKFSPDGRSLVVIAEDNRLKIWNVKTNQFLKIDDYLKVDTIEFSPEIPGIMSLNRGNPPVINYLDYDWNHD
ncbi:Serine/threonine-protein kinase PrkC [Polystyrenella longa]|uniref:Serine/threonine-protein kinase PrkC n=1 Tax=Polystyrenella longa TaxID=2528007 RepID=A0A518CTN6_9PLAN|nr:protein kinase [Polystyrenella longa]QDU82586.1 Serine/threonine-protein kinase PrkC [Polystyrenella longa]